MVDALRHAAQGRRDRRRAEHLARLVEHAADNVLDEAEFTEYLARTGQRRYLVDQRLRQTREATAEFLLRRRLFRRRCGAAAGRALTAATGTVILVVALVRMIHAPQHNAVATAALFVGKGFGLGLTGQIFGCVLAAGTLIALGRSAAGYAVAVRTERRRYLETLPEQVRPLVRLDIMRLAQDRERPELRLTSAPGLSSASDPLHRVARPEMRQIENLMRQLGASAIAISGPRGAGKSTLLRDLAEADGPPHDLVVAVDAAVNYQARDFTILLFRALCEAVIEGTGRDRWWTITGRTARLTHRYATTRMRRRARHQLRRLRFLQNVSRELSGVFKSSRGFDIGRKWTRQLIEQPASHPDLVREFRRFAADVAEWWTTTRPGGGRVIVVIDEVDRINDGELAEKFINEIKGVFGVRGCTYLVTISEDALALFERRMIGIRPALDSTFDEVLRLGIMTLDDSVELLGRRLIGCPRPFMALCHALAGGLPRELLRAARTLVGEAGAEDGRTRVRQGGLAVLTERVVGHDIVKLKSGLAAQIRREGQTGPIHQVLMDLADTDWPGTEAKELLQRGDDLIHRAPVEDPGEQRLCLQLGVSLWYYATVLETFGLPPEPARPCHDRLDEAAERLALVRSVMPASVEQALTRLTKLRHDLGLEVPLPDGDVGRGLSSAGGVAAVDREGYAGDH
ncbi:AAA family ATPase [Paractinoplanes lichenicola]|uniref:AAA+ ATPase domain-containing protein n=1 Tax=Paractinoplanes lichenicola TaxID=2802976 RepID=A0ABS1W332_9ACTN|nr:AAA family ATPase [Actinoplanes lichenicola]MBL7261135.1 hypothetical protein [Actinoplanes lichenicola]